MSQGLGESSVDFSWSLESSLQLLDDVDVGIVSLERCGKEKLKAGVGDSLSEVVQTLAIIKVPPVFYCGLKGRPEGAPLHQVSIEGRDLDLW